MCERVGEGLGVCVSVRRTGDDGETRRASWEVDIISPIKEMWKLRFKRGNTVRAG